MIDDESFEDFFLASFVIGSRMWRMASGHPSAHREAAEMVSEKVEACADGMIALQAGWFRLGMGLATAPLEPGSWTAPAQTFAAPARKTLRKNARRLAGSGG